MLIFLPVGHHFFPEVGHPLQPCGLGWECSSAIWRCSSRLLWLCSSCSFLSTCCALLLLSFPSLQPVLSHATSQCIVVPLVARLHRCVALCWRLIISSVLAESTFPSLCLLAGHSSTNMPRVRDWSSVVASCHASLTEWHQHVLSLSSSPLPSTPSRVSALDAVFSSLTQILFDGASFHSRREPASTLLSQEATLVVERRLLPRPRCSQQLLA